MDRLRTMEVFAKVVETGSFTAAARALRIPRASATTLVQALEARLGVRLLHRTTRKVTPSAEGAVYYEEASRLLRELDELETGLVRAAVSPKGRVRVDVAAAAGRHLLAPAVPDFLARYPELTLELGSSDRPVDVLDEGIDCVIRGGDLHDETLVARKLGVLPVITCAAPSYLSRWGTPHRPDQLHEHVFVNFLSPKTGRMFEVDFTGPDGTVLSLLPRHRVAANDTDTWLALAVAGMGLIQVPCGVSVRAYVQRGVLSVVLPSWRPEGLPIFVMYPRTRKLAARVRVFVDWVTELYEQECRLAEQFIEENVENASGPSSSAPDSTGSGS